MIVIAKKTIRHKELRSTLKNYAWYLPEKKIHYPEIIIFQEGHSYNVRLNGDSYKVNTEHGVLFFYKDSGPGVPEELFRIFSQ